MTDSDSFSFSSFEMRKGTKILLGGAALAAAAMGAVGAVVIKRNGRPGGRRKSKSVDSWARPGMTVVFRAELMPGRSAAERTFRVTTLLPSGRVLLDGVAGEHTEKEFQSLR